MEKIKNRVGDWWKSTSLLDKVLTLFGLCGAAFAFYYIFVNSYVDFNSDTATSNLLAREQTVMGTLFPKTWGYGNEVWIIFYNLLILPFSLFIKNQFLLRAIGVLIVAALSVFLLCRLMKKELHTRAYLVFLPLYFMGTSFETSCALFGEATYGFFFMQYLLVTILGMLSVDENFVIQKKNFIAFCAIAFYYAVRSMRTLLSVSFPVAIGVLLLYLIRHKNMDKDSSAAAFKRILKWGLPLVGVVAAGAILNGMLTKYCTVYQGAAAFKVMDFDNGTGFFKNLSNQITQVFIMFGYNEGAKVMTKGGMLMLLRMVIAVVLAGVLPVLMTKKYKAQSKAMQQYIVIVWLLLAVNMVLLLFTQMGEEDTLRYILANVLMLLTLSACYIYEYMLKGNASVVRFFVMACIALILVYQPAQLVAGRIAEYHTVKARDEALQEELLERDLHFGYASYWNSHKYSALYDFDPEIAAVNLQRKEPDFWLTTTRVYAPEYYTGDTFLLFDQNEVPDNEEQRALKSKFGEPKEIFTCANYTIYVYDYNISQQFFTFTGKETRELLPFMLHSEQGHLYEQHSVLLKEGDVLYGPYITLEAGTYSLNVEAKSGKAFEIRIMADGGSLLKTLTMTEEEQNLVFTLEERAESLEFVILNSREESITLRSLALTRAE